MPLMPTKQNSNLIAEAMELLKGIHKNTKQPSKSFQALSFGGLLQAATGQFESAVQPTLGYRYTLKGWSFTAPSPGVGRVTALLYLNVVDGNNLVEVATATVANNNGQDVFSSSASTPIDIMPGDRLIVVMLNSAAGGVSVRLNCEITRVDPDPSYVHGTRDTERLEDDPEAVGGMVLTHPWDMVREN